MSLPTEIKELISEYKEPSFRVSKRESTLVIGGRAYHGESTDPTIKLDLKVGLWHAIRSPSRNTFVKSESMRDIIYAPVFSIILYHDLFNVSNLPKEIRCKENIIDGSITTLNLCQGDKTLLEIPFDITYTRTIHNPEYNHTIYTLQGVYSDNKLVALVIPVAFTYSDEIESNYKKILNTVQENHIQELKDDSDIPFHIVSLDTIFINHPTSIILQQLGLDGKEQPRADDLKNITITWEEGVTGEIKDPTKPFYTYVIDKPNDLLSRFINTAGTLSLDSLKYYDKAEIKAAINKIASELEPMYSTAF